jgi:hypothetical protein
MTATLWINTEREETIELGGTFQMYSSFAEMARVANDDTLSGWPALSGVTYQVELQEDAPPDWLAEVRQEASTFLAAYEDSLSSGTVFLLKLLAGAPYDEE